MTSNDKAVTWHHASVSREQREAQNRHRSLALWFTGLSGSGKSTLAHAVEARLHGMGCRSIVLDGDNVRHGLCSDLGFSEADRHENIRRIGETLKLFVEAGVVVLAAFISPYRRDRARVRALLGSDNFVEIYCRCAVEICEQRDTKGLYRRARAGEIREFTGISAPYEEPQAADLTLDTGHLTLEAGVERVLERVKPRIWSR